MFSSMYKSSVRIPLFLLLLIPLSAIASTDYQNKVTQLINSGFEPEGVVFEIVGKKGLLDWALPVVVDLSTQLRAKYPRLDIAVVSHGSEQFALTKDQLALNKALQEQLADLQSSEISVHVCGTLAEWRGVEASEFTELVDVAAEGPAQINDYIKLGYVRIRISP